MDATGSELPLRLFGNPEAPDRIMVGATVYRRSVFDNGDTHRKGGHSLVLPYKCDTCNDSVVLKVFGSEHEHTACRERSLLKAIMKTERGGFVLPLRGSTMVNSTVYLCFPLVWGDFIHLAHADIGSDRVRVLLRYLRAAASGLKLLHEGGVVHGDVKPDNIMLGLPDGSVSVTDMSFASVSNQFMGLPGGTPGYTSPFREINYGRGSPRDDIFAMAVTVLVVVLQSPPTKYVRDGGGGRQMVRSMVQTSPVYANCNKNDMVVCFLKGLEIMGEALLDPDIPAAPIGFLDTDYESWIDYGVLLAAGRAEIEGVHLVPVPTNGLKA